MGGEGNTRNTACLKNTIMSDVLYADLIFKLKKNQRRWRKLRFKGIQRREGCGPPSHLRLVTTLALVLLPFSVAITKYGTGALGKREVPEWTSSFVQPLAGLRLHS